MASFCTKCGAAVSPDAPFCTACGAPTGAAAIQPGAPPASNYTYAAAPAVPVAPPSSGGSSALKIILIIVGVFVALGIIAVSIFAFTVWRVSRAIHVDANGENMSIHTPGGTVSTSQTKTYSASDLGTDPYPGAQSARGGMKMDLPGVKMVTGVFMTSDSKDKVVDFYKDKLGSGASVMDTPETTIITLGRGEKDSVMVTVTQNPSQDDGKTKIAIVHTKKS